MTVSAIYLAEPVTSPSSSVPDKARAEGIRPKINMRLKKRGSILFFIAVPFSVPMEAEASTGKRAVNAYCDTGK
jgi:hypothetical protein